jgi:hypothetical protein
VTDPPPIKRLGGKPLHLRSAENTIDLPAGFSFLNRIPMSMAHDATEPVSRSLPAFVGFGVWKRARPLMLTVLGVLLLATGGLLQAAEEELTPLSKIPADEPVPLPKLPPDELTPLPNLSHDSPVRFNAVKAWRGSFIASAHQYTNDDIIEPNGRSRGKRTIYYDSSIVVDFLLDEFEDDPAVWRGKLIGPKLVADYRGVSNQVIDSEDGNTLFEEEFFHTNGPPLFDPGDKAELLFHRERGWSFHFPTPNCPAELTYNLVLTPKKGPVVRERTQREISASPETGTPTLPYPAKGFILFAGNNKCEHGRSVPGSLVGEVVWEYTVYLEPASMEELKLEIEETDAYKQWRPETTPECAAGAPLNVKAKVVDAKGGTPQVSVEKFVWELIETSKEPGVAMNFPLEAKDQRFDLDLDAEGEFFLLENKNQRMTRAVRSGFSDTVKVVPYDWGGWATLQVTAYMRDGRQVRGKVKGRTEVGLRLPKRSADSHIADVWKEQKKSGADDLDDESVAGQKDNGDGFSLYEEYRGFVVDGQRIEGDPEQKDFFVLNLIGADAQAGLDLFTAVSQLAVHDRLKPAEMSEKTRLMNGNHRRGARNQEQHGVWIKTFASVSALGGSGAFTTLNKTGVGGRPGLVDGIGILARTSEDSDFNKPFNLAASDMIFAYDRAIAHELLHSVGVEHHGEGDYNMIVGYASTRNPLNKTGRPYYGTELEKPIDLRTEEGEDVAQRDIPEYIKMRQFLDMILLDRCLKEGEGYIKRNGVGYSGYKTPQDYADFQIEILGVFCFMHISGIVGVDHGEHSGAEDCLMRYYFAKYYESKKPATIGNKQYYLIGDGTEHTGLQICHDKIGTGVNAPGHKPQSRYGDAANGDCFTSICPNDGVPPSTTTAK